MTAIDPITEVMATTKDVQRLAARVSNGKYTPGFQHVLSGLETDEDIRTFLDT